MAKTITIAAAALLTGAVALPALGAGRISVPGTDAASASTIEVLSWSWGVSNHGSGSPRREGNADVCNPCTTPVGSSAAVASAPQPGPTISGSAVQTAREAGSGMATGRRQHQPVRAPDRDCDDDDCDSATAPAGAFAAASRRASIDRFTVSVANLPATLARLCAKPEAAQTLSLSMDGEDYTLDIAKVQGCPANAMPNRISMNVSRQAAPACTSGACTADTVQLTFTGSMKHTKTGHVTLMK